jgi:transposase
LLSLIIKTTQFLVYHLLIVVVDRVSRLPRSGVQPEVERILRENLALKAQVRALVLELKSERGARPKVSLRTRAAQVFAYLLTQGDSSFQNYYLSASDTTIERWATRLRRGPWPWRRKNLGGRPPLAQDLKDLIIRLKTDNPLWGAHRIKDELARMGVRVSEPTIQKVLRESGFQPTGGHPLNLDKWRAAVKDAIWALDFFFVRTAKGVWLNVLLVIDLHTKEILELRACDAWGPTAEWTIRTFAAAIHREGRQPGAAVHDHTVPRPRRPLPGPIRAATPRAGDRETPHPGGAAVRERDRRAGHQVRAAGDAEPHPRGRRRGAAVVPRRVPRLL